MTLDAAPLAQFVAEFMDDLEKEYGEDATLIDAVICVEIDGTDEDGDEANFVEARALEGRNTSAIGIATRALNAMQE